MIDFPDEQRIVEIMAEEARESMWFGRAIDCVLMLWPVLRIVADKRGKQIDADLFKELLNLNNLYAFGVDNSETTEGKNVLRYIERLPGWRALQPSLSAYEQHRFQMGLVFRATLPDHELDMDFFGRPK